MSHNDSTENKRRQLLEAFGRQRGAGSRDAITRQARPADLPASAEQVRMWVQMAISGGAGHFHVPHVLEIAGTLDEAALQAALCDVVARHEALRTTFDARDGGLYQRVHPEPIRRCPCIVTRRARPTRTSPARSPPKSRSRSTWRTGRCCACRCIVSATRGRFSC